ncbi:MAG: aromatic amino acid transport family protein, partial [Pseudoalteromonas sp.]
IIIAIVIGTVVTLGTSKVDKLNRVLFTIKIIALASLFYILTPYVQSQNLLEMPIEQGLILSAIPVVFTSFGFHGSIPSIVKYVGIDIKTLRKVMFAGAALPLIIYIFWQLIIQGIMSQAVLLKSTNLPGFVSSMSSIANNSAIATAVNLFADLALATSFLGVSLGLFDFFADALKKGDGSKDRIKTALITFIPPLGFALFYPQGFIVALGYAAIALVILAIFLPVAMVYKQRKQGDQTGYAVPGGNIGLALATLCGVLIISAQGMQIAELIPAIG